MTNNHVKHPNPEQLKAFGLGKLALDQAEIIAVHLDDCPDCSDTILNLQDDTFLDLVRNAPGSDQTEMWDEDSWTVLQQPSSVEDLPLELREHPRYEITGLIGHGGMGAVYRARHKLMDRPAALKIINPGLMSKPAVIDRFQREVKTAAQLSHPNIVTTHDADQVGGLHFMVMEFVDGTDLSQIVGEQGPLPADVACGYVMQAAKGLQYAHEQGMVHRDIKPHNMMVTSDGTVKILDFGLAALTPETFPNVELDKTQSELTSVGTVMGSPDFISPEQAADARKADSRSDIYSLGATFYYLLTAKTLFTEGNALDKLKSHATKEPEPVDSIRDDLPKGLSTIVSRMLEKNPQDRYQTAADLVKALQVHSKDSDSVDSPQPSSDGAGRIRIPGMLVAAFGFIFLIFCSIVYYIQTNNGTVRVEVLDESLKVSIEGETITMDDGSKKPITLRAGEHKLVVRQGDTEFITDNFEIRRNDKIAFKVDLIDGEIVLLSKTGKKLKSALSRAAQLADIEARRPSLKLFNDETKSTIFSNEVRKNWIVECNRVGSLKVQLLHLLDGKIFVANESVLDFAEVGEGKTKGTISFRLKDLPKDNVSLSLHVECENVSPAHSQTRQSSLVLNKGFGRSKAAVETTWEGQRIAHNQSELIHTLVQFPRSDKGVSGFSYGVDDPVSMLEATRKGAEFVVVTVKWQTINASNKMSSNELVEDLTKANGNLKDKLKRIISESSGIPNKQWERFASDPTGNADSILGEPLSWILLNLNPLQSAKRKPNALQEFQHLQQLLNPKALHDSMNQSQVNGYYSMIQPNNIGKLNYQLTTSTFASPRLEGRFHFLSPKLYQGQVQFVAEVDSDKNLILTEFSLPSYGIRLKRSVGDLWTRIQPQSEETEIQTNRKNADKLEAKAISWVKSVDGQIIRDKSVPGIKPVIYVGLRRGAGSNRDANAVTDEGLMHLAAFTQLEKLDLGVSPMVTQKGIESLAELPKLMDLMYSPENNACIEALSRLKNLKRLSLFQAKLTDPDLKAIARLPLEKLDLSYTPISNDGLKHFVHFQNLDTLHLKKTAVSDKGMKQIAAMNPLRNLNLSETKITRSGLEEITQLKSLEVLSLEGLELSDAEVELLAAFPRLRKLGLHNNPITDQGMKTIGKLKELRRLSLVDTRITDEGIKFLSRCGKLEAVDLYKTKVTRKGTAVLGAQLPNCLLSTSFSYGEIPNFEIKKSKSGFILSSPKDDWP